MSEKINRNINRYVQLEMIPFYHYSRILPSDIPLSLTSLVVLENKTRNRLSGIW